METPERNYKKANIWRKIQRKMKFLLDTDIGSDIDDALALLTLLKLSPESLVGVTTVYACADLRAKIACKLLKKAGYKIPVIAGESQPLFSPEPLWTTGHEGDGILTLEERNSSLEEWGIPHGAAKFIVEQAFKYKNELILLCIAPLTNIALAMKIEPRLPHYVHRVFFMGGGITHEAPLPSKLMPNKIYRAQPSHNILMDVEAARIVFQQFPKIHLITNDVTSKVWWGRRRIEKFLRTSQEGAELLVAQMLRVWLRYRSELFGHPVHSVCLHDVLTVTEALKGGWVDYIKGQLEINSDGSTHFCLSSEGNVKAAFNVRKQDFLTWFNALIFRTFSFKTISKI